MFNDKSVASVLAEATVFLRGRSIERPRREAEDLLCFVMDCDRLYLYVNSSSILEEDEEIAYSKVISRRGEHYPLQYLLGVADFCGLELKVNEAVLIPRPETELMVEYITKYLVGKEDLLLADIGTGSGAIAISVAHATPNASAIAIDISERALQVACENAKKHGVESRVEFLQGDLLVPLIERCNLVDVIASNPPYIPTVEIATLQIEVGEFEPKLALDGGHDGLDFYRRIISSAVECLKPGGLLIVEVGAGQAEVVQQLFISNSFTGINRLIDFQGHDRIVLGYKKKTTIE